jgi:hypothetical protein
MDYISQLYKDGEDICLVDSATTHTILRDRKFFSTLVLTKANVTTISGSADLIEGSDRAHIRLTHGTQLFIEEALYSSRSRRNVQSFMDIHFDIILRPQMIIMWNTFALFPILTAKGIYWKSWLPCHLGCIIQP